MSHGLTVDYDPKLIEDAVFYAQGASAIAGELAQQRERIYEVARLEEREELFRELYRNWFEDLGLGKPVQRALQEQAIVAAQINSCYVLCASHAKQEGAELFVVTAPASWEIQRRNLRILLRPESLLKSDAALEFLRHELFHIADMLEPAFAYQPTLPRTEGGPTYDTLITNRYRALWDVTIAGRMLRRGWCATTARDRALDDFHQAFPMLEGEGESFFQRFFDADAPHHQELAAFACDPRGATNMASNQAVAGSHCPLCRFPTHAFSPAAATLDAEAQAAIATDFPNWTPAMGLCVQCADLYRGRQMSMAALRTLPGWNASI